MSSQHYCQKSSCHICPSMTQGIFKDLSLASLDKVDEKKVFSTYQKGQSLFVEGSPTYGVFCIKKGNVKITKMAAEGRESILRLVGTGDVIGHTDLFRNETHNSTAIAMDTVEVCFLDRKSLSEMLNQEQTVALNMIEKMSLDIAKSENSIASQHHDTVMQRLCALLLDLASTHGEIVDKNKIKLNIRLTREEMASLVGTAPETLIRFFSVLKDEKSIELEGKVIFINKIDQLKDRLLLP